MKNDATNLENVRANTASVIIMKFSAAWYLRSFLILPVVKFQTSINPSTDPDTKYWPEIIDQSESRSWMHGPIRITIRTEESRLDVWLGSKLDLSGQLCGELLIFLLSHCSLATIDNKPIRREYLVCVNQSEESLPFLWRDQSECRVVRVPGVAATWELVPEELKYYWRTWSLNIFWFYPTICSEAPLTLLQQWTEQSRLFSFPWCCHQDMLLLDQSMIWPAGSPGAGISPAPSASSPPWGQFVSAMIWTNHRSVTLCVVCRSIGLCWPIRDEYLPGSSQLSEFYQLNHNLFVQINQLLVRQLQCLYGLQIRD